QEQACGVAIGIAGDLPSWRLRRIPGVANGTQGSTIEQSPVIEMQQEYRRIGRDRVDFVEGRQPLLNELMFGEAADHANPLWRWCDGHLTLEHVHGVSQRTHTVPAQFQELAVFDGDSTGDRVSAIKRSELAVSENDVGNGISQFWTLLFLVTSRKGCPLVREPRPARRLP
nr:hypothetical protein [Tanacetum cinerariifolium]